MGIKYDECMGWGAWEMILPREISCIILYIYIAFSYGNIGLWEFGAHLSEQDLMGWWENKNTQHIMSYSTFPSILYVWHKLFKNVYTVQHTLTTRKIASSRITHCSLIIDQIRHLMWLSTSTISIGRRKAAMFASLILLSVLVLASRNYIVLNS